MVFFSKNKQTAQKYVEQNIGKGTPVLAKEQIKHISGWKTWKIK